jgi:hypothetical protein
MCFHFLREETTDGKLGQISNFAAPAPGKYSVLKSALRPSGAV